MIEVEAGVVRHKANPPNLNLNPTRQTNRPSEGDVMSPQ